MGLGWLRLLLSLMVIDAHYGGFRLLVQPAIVNALGVDRVAFVGEGEVAIAGFFVISGYVIAYVLARKYDPRSWRGIGTFLLGRALRIYPLYLLLFGAFWAALALIGAPPQMPTTQFLNNLLLLPLGVVALLGDHQHLGPMQLTGQLLIGPAWTLCFDLLFYILAPFLLVRKRILWITWSVGLIYFVAFIVTLDPRPPIWFAYLYTSPIAYLFAFTSGALVFHYGDRLAGNRWLLTVLLAGLLWLTYFPWGLTNAALNQLLAILLLTGVVAVLKDFGRGRRWDRLFGDLTYATYLLHLPLLLLLERLQVTGAPWWGLALTYLLAWGLLYAVEYPLDRWRERLHHRLAATPGAPMRALRIATGAIVAAMTLAAATSFARNALNGGHGFNPIAATCPASWRCVPGTASLRVDIVGEGAVDIDPSLATGQRVLIDLRNGGTTGSVFAGLEIGGPDGLKVGIERRGSNCTLVVQHLGQRQPAPAGWGSACTALHRFVVDGSTGAIVVAVDSLWVYPTTQRQSDARMSIRAGPGSDGSVVLSDVFTTARPAN